MKDLDLPLSGEIGQRVEHDRAQPMIELGQHGDRHLVAPLVERAQILHVVHRQLCNVALGKKSLLCPALFLGLRLLPTLLVCRFVSPDLIGRLMCRLWPCLFNLVPAGKKY